MGGISGSNALYLNVSCGKIVNKKKEISYYAYEGLLLGIKQEMDEYEGKEISKIRLKFKDSKSEEIALISFSEESWFSQGFFSRIEKIDLTHPFTLGCSQSDKNEKVSFCWMKQYGSTVEANKEFARPTKTSRGKDNYDALIEATSKIIPVINTAAMKNETAPPAENYKDKTQGNQNIPAGETEDWQDLIKRGE